MTSRRLQDKWTSIEDRTKAFQEASEHERQQKAQEAAQRHAQQTARFEDLVSHATVC